MQFNKKWFPVLLVLAVVAGYFAFFRVKNNSSNTVSNISTTTNETSGVTTTNDGNFTIEQISGESNVVVPDLNRKVIFSSAVNLDDATKKIISDKVLSLQSNLKKDSKDLASWLDLGIYQKMAGDYEGAVISWKYVSSMSTSDFISLGNLGDLYGYYIKDKKLSEDYYKKAIKNAPTQVYLYTQLSGLYKDVFKDISKANAILDEGLRVVPGDQTLLQYKQNLK